nr:MAG TPA: replisome organizer [Caudoviricetes sp.]DAV56841.1 MAG TPA: replisome organizer [Caudoviricetes sp.]
MATNIWDNRKIVQIESLPDGDTIIVIWLKLLCLAGTTNDSGMVYFTKEIPYTEQMLSTLFNRPLATIQFALKVFQEFEMISIIDDFLQISNWKKYQNIEGMDKIREQNRIRKQNQRERQKIMIEQDMSRDMSRDVTQQNKIKNKKEDIDKEKDNKLIVSKDTICQTDVRRVIEEWNKLQEVGINPIRDIKPSSKRYQLLKGRIREYGIDEVLNAINNVCNSDFLRGENNRGWMITFDWFVKPNNFTKVLEGNYNVIKGGDIKHGTGRTAQAHVKPLIPFDQCGGSEISDTPFAD